MGGWRSLLNADPTDWLLDVDNPSARYFTLRVILEKHDDDSEVVATKKEIMSRGIVHHILSKQRNAGYWGNPDDFFYFSLLIVF